MLVLTRKRGQEIQIGEDITVSVVKLAVGRVQLAINAPHEIPIHRKEVYDAISSDTDVDFYLAQAGA